MGIGQGKRPYEMMSHVKIDGVIHGGSGGGYVRGCRCDDCREANRFHRSRRYLERCEELRNNPDMDLPHGTEATYTNWGCRCDPCREAKKEKNARNYRRRQEAK